MNKKLLTVASVVALTLMAFAKSAKVQDDCVFCGGDVSYIEDDPAPVPSQKGDSTCIFCGEGGVSGGGSTTYYWSAATTRSVIFTDGEYYAGSATIKTGKYNKKKGTVAVSISFKMKNGKKYTAKETSVKPDEDWTLNASWSNVKGIGAVDISIGIDGSV